MPYAHWEGYSDERGHRLDSTRLNIDSTRFRFGHRFDGLRTIPIKPLERFFSDFFNSSSPFFFDASPVRCVSKSLIIEYFFANFTNSVSSQ